MKRIIAGLAVLAFMASPAIAGVITGVTNFAGQDGTGPGVGAVTVVVVPVINPNNDNQTGATPAFDNNINVPIKRFDFPGHIDIEFHVFSLAGVSEYKLTESIDNNTGLPWSGYTMELGFGVGANFVPSAALDGLDFDAPGFDPAGPSSGAFSNVAAGEDVLVFSNGLHGPGQQVYELRIDVPDLARLVGAIGTFTLRQTPIPIPELSTGLLACCSLAASSLIGLRRRS